MGYSSTNRIQDQVGTWSDNATEAMQSGVQHARETVSSYPGTSVLTAFGVGLGVGVCLALAMAPSRSSPYSFDGFREKFTQFVNEHAPWMNS